MIKIIINADDLGKNPEVNRSIEEAFCHNHISSTTILANTVYWDVIKRIEDKYGDTKSFGVHLNITEGRSLTNSILLRKSGMIDDSGCFIREKNFESRLYDENLIDAIAQEWDAQVNEVLSKGIKISHVDGHHHCHAWYGYTVALCSVLKKYGIKKVRNTFLTPFSSAKEKMIKKVSEVMLRNHILDTSRNIKMNRVYFSIRLNQDKLHYLESTKNFIKTDYFGAYETICHQLEMNNHFCNESNNTVIELMCHPGHPNYFDEYNMIKNDKIGIKQNPNFMLINYNEL